MNEINHPRHYNTGKIEVIDAIEDWSLGFHEGNVVKYVARAKHKGKELEDLKKAAWYMERRIRQIEPIGMIELEGPAKKLARVGVNETSIEICRGDDSFVGTAQVTATGKPEDIRELFDALDMVLRR